MKKTKKTKKTKRAKRARKTRFAQVESLPQEGIWRAVAVGLSEMVEYLLGIEFQNEEGPSVDAFYPSKTVELTYKGYNLGMDEIDLLSRLRNVYHGDAEDGKPAIDVQVYAQKSTEDNREFCEFLKQQDRKVWKEAIKYEYDGTFEVRVTFYFSENDWKKYGGYVEEAKE